MHLAAGFHGLPGESPSLIGIGLSVLDGVPGLGEILHLFAQDVHQCRLVTFLHIDRSKVVVIGIDPNEVLNGHSRVDEIVIHTIKHARQLL